MHNPLSATPEEVLSVVQELYPEQFSRAVAELTIRKQRQYIDVLEAEIAKINEAANDPRHTHNDD